MFCMLKSGPSGDLRSICKLYHSFSTHIGMLRWTETHNFAKHLLKMQTRFRILIPKPLRWFKLATHKSSHFFSADIGILHIALWSLIDMLYYNDLWRPEFETGCLARACRIEAPAILALGVHRGAFRNQKLRSRDAAVYRRRVQRRLASGAFSRKPVWPQWASGGTTAQRPMRRGDVERCGNAELHRHNRQRNDECFGLNILKSIQSKKTFTNTLNKFQYIFLITFPLVKRCVIENVQRTDKASKTMLQIVDNMVWNQVLDLKRPKV